MPLPVSVAPGIRGRSEVVKWTRMVIAVLFPGLYSSLESSGSKYASVA